MMRPLTVRQAQACENATHPRCECRCGGTKHGAARVVTRAQFSDLPVDDPHYRPSLTRRAALVKLQRIMRAAVAQAGAWGDIDYAYLLTRDLVILTADCAAQIRGRVYGNSSTAPSI